MLPLTLFAALACGASHAQVAEDGPIRLSHVEGVVVNSTGKPVGNVEVTLSRDEAVLLTTHTDPHGAFHFNHAAGNYVLRVARTDYAPAVHEIVAREEVVTLLQRKKLYIIVGPGACADACSSFLTSKRELDHAIRKTSRH